MRAVASARDGSVFVATSHAVNRFMVTSSLCWTARKLPCCPIDAWNFLVDHREQVWESALTHARLVGTALLIAVPIAVAVGRAVRMVVRDLATGHEVEIDTGDVRKGLAVSGADDTIVFVGWPADAAPDQIYMVRPGAAPVALTNDEADKTILDVSAAGTAVLFGPRRRGAASGVSQTTIPIVSVPTICPDGPIAVGAPPSFRMSPSL